MMTPTGLCAIPDDLVERDQWVLWRREQIRSHETKVPYSVARHRASSTNPQDWSSFEDALAEWRRNPGYYAGLGFVFSDDDPFIGIDLDDCLDETGTVKDWAEGIVRRFFDSYMETSPSGQGVKIFARSHRPLPANLPGVRVGDGQIEMYWRARYFAVTGRPFRGAPLQIEDHTEDLLALYQHLTAQKGRRWLLEPLEGGRIPHGQQHSTLVSIAGTLRARRVCDEAIEACLQTINTRQCERPGARENITRIVKSTRSWSQSA